MKFQTMTFMQILYHFILFYHPKFLLMITFSHTKNYELRAPFQGNAF